MQDLIDQLESLPVSSVSEVHSLNDSIKFFTQPVVWSSTMLFLISWIVFSLLSKNIRETDHHPYDLLITFGIPFIVLCSVFAVVLAPTKDSITPIVGLLGTVAGYLLGRNDNTRRTKEYKDTSNDRTAE
ncbi:MAG: hypothetical protein QTN59_20095 [Candidatus Electrothrix communis]|nr:MAG: hypothetical protein QTN59_20095 [Candidatus Electrothrix communis]